MSCGHLERRKRKASASKVACGQCGAAAGGVVPDDEATLLQYEGQVRAFVASEFRVELDAVSVETYMDGGFPKVGRVSVSVFRDILR